MIYPPNKKETCYTIPNTVVSLAPGAFRDAHNLIKLQFTNSVQIIDSFSLSVPNVKELIIPEGAVHIKENAFCWAWKLEKITLPSTLLYIEDRAFSHCDKLVDICIPHGLPYLNVTDLPHESIFRNTSDTDVILYLYGDPSLNSALDRRCKQVIQKKWDTYLDKIIRKNAPKALQKMLLLYAEVPLDILEKSILATNAAGASELTTILLTYKEEHYSKERVERIRTQQQDKQLHPHHMKYTDWQKIFNFKTKTSFAIITGYKGSENTILVPKKIGKYYVTEIGANAFKDCSYLEYVEIANGIVQIGSDAFSSCSNLAEVFLPKSVAEISVRAFSGCRNLKKVSIMNPDAEIRQNVFADDCDIVIYGPANSKIEKYAQKLKIPFSAI